MEWVIPRFGFSYIGALFLALLLIPNLLWMKNQPKGYTAEGESRVLAALERTGQVLVTSMSLCLSNFDLQPWTAWGWWLILAVFLMVLYEGFWLRYFRGRHILKDFYGSYCGVPVAGATLPVLAFFCLGLYGKSLWFLSAVLVLGIGHIGIHLQHRKALF